MTWRNMSKRVRQRKGKSIAHRGKSICKDRDVRRGCGVRRTFLVHTSRSRESRWRRGWALTGKYLAARHFHLNFILKMTRSLWWVLSCTVTPCGISISDALFFLCLENGLG